MLPRIESTGARRLKLKGFISAITPLCADNMPILKRNITLNLGCGASE